MTIAEIEAKRNEIHAALDRTEGGDGSHEELYGAYERAFNRADGLLEAAIRALKDRTSEAPE